MDLLLTILGATIVGGPIWFVMQFGVWYLLLRKPEDYERCFYLFLVTLVAFPALALFVGILRLLFGFAEGIGDVLWAPVILFIFILIPLLAMNLVKTLKGKRWNNEEPNKSGEGTA
jgi:hypothetical protein